MSEDCVCEWNRHQDKRENEQDRKDDVIRARGELAEKSNLDIDGFDNDDDCEDEGQNGQDGTRPKRNAITRKYGIDHAESDRKSDD